MNNNYKIISKVTLIILSVIGIAVALAFFISMFLGKSVGSLEVAGDFLAIPQFTTAYLCWVYILIGLGVVVAAFSIVVVLKMMFKTHPARAIALIVAIVSVPLLFGLCYFLGSPEQVNIIGYEGTDNVGFWARLSDACIYETYIYFGVALVVLFWGIIHSRCKK